MIINLVDKLKKYNGAFLQLIIVLLMIIVFYDYYLFKVVEKTSVFNTFTELSAYLAMSFIVMIILLSYLNIINSRLLFVIYITSSLEILGNYILKGAFHIGYVSLLIGLTTILYSLQKSDLRDKLYIGFENRINIKNIGMLAILMFFLAIFSLDGFTTPYETSILGDPIETWLLSGWDQSAYYRMVLQIVDGTWFFDGYGGGYFYPIGYPILGAIGYWIYEPNPFLYINVILYTISILFVFATLAKFTNKTFALVAIILLGLQSPIFSIDDNYMRMAVMPYNNIVTYCTSSMYLFYIFINREIRKYELSILGFAVGIVLISRIGDAVFFFIPLMYLAIYKCGPNKIKNVCYALAPLFFFLIITLYLNKLFYGQFLTFYTDFAGKHEYWFHPFAVSVHIWKIIEVFFIPLVSDPGHNSSFFLPMAYIVFMPIGIYHLFKKRKLSEILVSLMLVMANIVYFTSADAVSAGAIKYDVFRYFSPVVVFSLFFSFIGIYTYIKCSKKIQTFAPVICIFLVMYICAGVIKTSIIEFINHDFSIKYIGTEDLVARKSYPNYEKDGFQDYIFKISFNSIFPVQLISVSVLGPHGGTFNSENINVSSNLWGVGIINEYGKNVQLGWGDNVYKNSYLDKKDILLILPIPGEEMLGDYIFTIETTLGKVQRKFKLN